MGRTEALKLLNATGSEDSRSLKKLYVKALRHAHPDAGGSNEAYYQVQQAYKFITEPPDEGIALVDVGSHVYRHSSLFSYTRKKVG